MFEFHVAGEAEYHFLAVAGAYHEGAVGGGDDVAIEAVDDGGGAVGYVDEAVAGVVGEGVALDGVAAAVARGDVVQALPGLHVAPAEGGGQHVYVGRLLHDALIDGDGVELGIELFQRRVRREERGVEECLPQGGKVLFIRLLQHGERPDEDAGVPVELAAGDELARHLDRGLLGEGGYGVEVLHLGQRVLLAALYVAVGGGGVDGLHAQGEDPGVALHGVDSLAQVGLELLLAEDGMVRGHHDEGGLGVESGDGGGGIGYAGGGATAQGLAEHLVGLQVANLLVYVVDVLVAGNDDDVLSGAELGTAAEGGLQHGAPGAHDVEELLGVVGLAQRPKAAPHPTGHNHAPNVC